VSLIIENLERLLATGKDAPTLRFSLGSAYLKEGDRERAIEHLARAVELDEAYSAAWKLYGRALADSGRTADAQAAYQTGIEVAEKKGDVQAAKEMKVFLKRLEDRDS